MRALRLTPHLVLLLVAAIGSVRGSMAAETSAPRRYLDQGWDADLREKFYFTPQGSRLIPYAWFLALEQADNHELFLNAEHLAGYGWLLPEKASGRNPDRLPVGFAKEPGENGKPAWLGITCAACHTNDVRVGSAVFRIDGAPAMVDFDRFLQGLSRAVTATLFDESKFQRFAEKVSGDNSAPERLNELRAQYTDYAGGLEGRVWMRRPPHAAGIGRVDALGQIINSMAVVDLDEPDNLRSASAPVSYPQLWLTPHLDWVQWNPVAASPIARNVGEVLGVFGHVNMDSTPPKSKTELFVGNDKLRQYIVEASLPEAWRGKTMALEGAPPLKMVDRPVAAMAKPTKALRSTARLRNLHLLEEWIAKLKPPVWHEAAFGKIDVERAKLGKRLFDHDCRGCHNMPPFDLTAKEENIAELQFIKIARVNYRKVGTDPTYVENLVRRFTKTGRLADVFDGEPYVPAGRFFLGTVQAVVHTGMNDLELTPQERLAYHGFRFYKPVGGEKPVPYSPPAMDDLKAGPLLGIWATGPFLHNGSVPNIYELLLPEDERSREFWVGSRELDTQKLGFVSRKAPGMFRFDTRLPGNGNRGHAYPARGYSEEERLAVIEYLKDPNRITELGQP